MQPDTFDNDPLPGRRLWATPAGAARHHHGISPTQRRRVVLITGASAGIGRELAGCFARGGYQLILVARREALLLDVAAELREQFSVDVDVIAQDLSATGAAETLFTEVRSRGIRVDILVNNAGFAIAGEFARTDPDAQVKLLRVNVLAVTQLVRLFLPSMVEAGWGRILNVASIGAFMPGPLTATYFASKAFVLSLSEALSYELRGTGVTVTALCPGPTDTGFARRAGLDGCKAFSARLTDPAAVARCGYESTLRGKSIAIPGLRNRLRMLAVRCLPRTLLAHFSRKYHDVSGCVQRPTESGVTSVPRGRQAVRRVTVPDLEADLDGRRYRNGQQNPDDPKQHAVDQESDQDRHRVQRHRLA